MAKKREKKSAGETVPEAQDGAALATRCDPTLYERKWYDYWQSRGLFAPALDGRPGFCMVIPPPNVTGVLHMGHALNTTVQDVLLRYHKLIGDDSLWVPGMDHAGIATQNVVEKQLRAEGKTRQELGREKFVERVWEWKDKAHDNIKAQLERMGAGTDWTRERFTMDAQCSLAVRTAFKTLFDEGLIYKAARIINWCPRCKTAISDIEVEYSDDDGAFYHLKYPIAGEDGEFIEIATTRPETMLGDSAVAVHPDDERYIRLHGKNCILPLVNREIPIILDEYVDKEFGSGALKITPAHDPNDFEIGLKHGLPQYNMLTEDGHITEDYPQYAGMDRFDCRKKIVEDLKAAGLLIKIEPYKHSVGHCYRCGVAIEPYISPQWFVRMKDLAAPAMQAVHDGRTTFVPGKWTKVYLDWLENIRDWCISRQLWWGHRIPVWTCAACGKQSSSIEDLKACPICGSVDVAQEEDVLDTWFSSGLWPLSTLGWPGETKELETFYPTSVLVTGFDIIFFWVARMMFFGMKFGNGVPFRHVFIHGLVRDENGKKMSKSFGNVLDPLHACDEFGTDSLRITFLIFSSMGQDVSVSEEKIRSGRNFCSKLWNAARYILMCAPNPASTDISSIDPANLDIKDKWLLSKMKRLSVDVRSLMDSFDLNEAAQRVYNFLWHDFCDWYIEMAKAPLRGEPGPRRDAVEAILHSVLRWNLVLLHPFMPYITEEIFSYLPGTSGSILEAGWPEVKFEPDAVAEADIKLLQDVVREIRDMRVGLGVAPSYKIDVSLDTPNADKKRTLNALEPQICAMAGVEVLSVGMKIGERSGEIRYMSGIAAEVQILVRISEERKSEELDRLNKKLAQLRVEMDKVEKKLGNESFISRAPADIVENEREKYNAIKADINKVEQRLGLLGGA